MERLGEVETKKWIPSGDQVDIKRIPVDIKWISSGYQWISSGYQMDTSGYQMDIDWIPSGF